MAFMAMSHIIGTVTCFFFLKKINDLLHGVHRQTMASTKYLLK